MNIRTTQERYFPRSNQPTRQESLRLAQEADHCVRWLRAQGFEVLCVQRAPLEKVRITIRTEKLCESLEGAVWRFDRFRGAEHRYWVAIRFGCEIRWDDMHKEVAA